MNTISPKLRLLVPLLAGTVVLALPSQAQAAGTDQIVGTWINTVKIVPCASPQTILATVQSMTTYHRDGTLIEGGGPATPPPAASRSAGHGIWEPTGRRSIQAAFRIHAFDGLGRLVRISEVTTHPTLVDGDDPATGSVEPYHLAGWGTNRISNLDPVSGAVISVTEGCNYATSRPMLVN